MNAIIKINVGGKIIMSKKENFIKFPLIEKLLSTKMSTDKDENGNIFIDRDPDIFGKILNDFRNERDVIVDNKTVEDECQFYGITYKEKREIAVEPVTIYCLHSDVYSRPEDEKILESKEKKILITENERSAFDELTNLGVGESLKLSTYVGDKHYDVYNKYYHTYEYGSESIMFITYHDDNADEIDAILLDIVDIEKINNRLTKNHIIVDW